jgi:2-polyprenyl-6-methoxyphenol hydroxylase-like FAD-dependent oxidoreductase
VLTGAYPEFEGVDAVYSPRRTVLDAILVDAARAAGAEVIEGFDVEEILTEGGRVTGIRGAHRGTGTATATTIHARLQVGAAGKHSRVARAVDAPITTEAPARTGGLYTYWSGLPAETGEMFARDGLMVGVWPTNDGLTLTFVGVPAARFAEFHADVEANMLAAFDCCGDLGARIRAATRAEHVRATPDTPNVVRKPYGPGWALVGDAGLVMDPITGQGIGHALRDAESLAAAVVAGLGGGGRLESALAAHHRARDNAVLAMYRFTLGLAAFRPDPAGAILFAALARAEQSRVDQFFGAITGAVPMADYMKPANLRGIVGLRGLFGMMRHGRPKP